MAVTSIWPIKGRVDKVINYARNPEKTHDKEKLSELHEIEGVVEYAADEMKTEKRAYVTCLHLHSEETAAQEFMETKRLMHNEGGRSCYHGYQSFTRRSGRMILDARASCLTESALCGYLNLERECRFCFRLMSLFWMIRYCGQMKLAESALPWRTRQDTLF